MAGSVIEPATFSAQLFLVGMAEPLVRGCQRPGLCHTWHKLKQRQRGLPVGDEVMTNQVGYAGGGTGTEDTSNKPSRNVWKGSPFKDIEDGYKGGTAIFEKFEHGPTAPASTTTTAGHGWRISTGTAATVTTDAAQGGGVILTTGASNVQTAMGALSQPFQITSGAKDLWWEARVEFDLVADNEPSFFIGLGDSTVLSTTKPVDNDGTYKANGVAEVVVGADAVTVVATTAVKIGMHFDSGTNVLTFYKNGVALADTKTIPDGGGTDFTADVTLGLIAGGVSGSGNAGLMTISWIRACQEV